MTPYYTTALRAEHDRTSFECGSAPLDAYLRQYARQDRDRSMAQVYVRCAPDGVQVVGYYTLCAFAVVRTDLPPGVANKLGRHELVPSVLLGRLATDRRWQGQGLGRALLIDALRRAFEASQTAAAALVLMHAKDGAAGFYARFGFAALLDEPNYLYQPMASVRKIIAATENR